MPLVQLLDRRRRSLQSLALCAAADLAVVFVFVAVGRNSHGETLSPGGLVHTAWPFCVGLAGGYLWPVVARRPASSIPSGLLISIKTVILGMVLRAAVQHEGTPVAFILVATVFLVGVSAGWRVIALRWSRPRTS